MLYVSHPVADEIKKHVRIIPELTEDETEKQIVLNKLETIEEELVLLHENDPVPWCVKRIYVLKRLDPTFKYRYREIIDEIEDECKYYAEGYGWE